MKKSAPGFIANRLQHALLREALYMAEEGLADPRDIDKALMYSFMPRYTSAAEGGRVGYGSEYRKLPVPVPV